MHTGTHTHEVSVADMNYHACERNDIHVHTDADLFVHGILLVVVCISVRFDPYFFLLIPALLPVRRYLYVFFGITSIVNVQKLDH